MKAQWDISRFIGFSLCVHFAAILFSAIFFSSGEGARRLVVVSAYSKVPTLFSFKPLALKDSSVQKSSPIAPKAKSVIKEVAKKQKSAQPKHKNEIKQKAAPIEPKTKSALKKSVSVEKKVESRVKEEAKLSAKKQEKVSAQKEVKKAKEEPQKVQEQPKQEAAATSQKEEPKVPEEKKEAPLQKDTQEVLDDALTDQATHAQDQLAFDGQSASVALQKELQSEVDRLWAPPPGVSKGTECIVEVSLDKKGKIASLELTRKSNILLFDLSVEEAAEKLELGRSFWNKSFHITFRQ